MPYVTIVPVEVFTLSFDIPWIVVLNDFRHGLMMGSLCFFWTTFLTQIVWCVAKHFVYYNSGFCFRWLQVKMQPAILYLVKTGVVLCLYWLPVSVFSYMNFVKGKEKCRYEKYNNNNNQWINFLTEGFRSFCLSIQSGVLIKENILVYP